MHIPKEECLCFAAANACRPADELPMIFRVMPLSSTAYLCPDEQVDKMQCMTWPYRPDSATGMQQELYCHKPLFDNCTLFDNCILSTGDPVPHTVPDMTYSYMLHAKHLDLSLL